MNKSLFKVLIATVIFLTASCTKDPEPSLYDPNYSSGQAPIISSVTPDPSLGALAGVTEITINGSNFSQNADDIMVSFSGTIADILSSSETQIKVKAPNLVSDSVELKISVHGAIDFSNIVTYKLIPAVSELYAFQDFEIPYALTTDSDGNVYTSLVSSNAGKGIMKITPDGEISNWAPKGGETFFLSMKMGANNSIYAVRTVRAVFIITEGNAAATFATVPVGVTLNDLDIDANLNIWTGGDNDAIYMINQAKEYKAFPFVGNVKSLRVFNNDLFAAAIVDSAYGIYKFPIINNDSLGAGELYFDIPNELSQNEFKIGAITFSQNGDLFIGTSLADPVLQVHPDKSYEYFYPGLMEPNVYGFAWNKGNILYYTRELTLSNSQTIIKVDTERPGSPYYGRDN